MLSTITDVLRRSHGSLTRETIMRSSQVSSTFKYSLDRLYHVYDLDDRAPYHRQGRRYDYGIEIRAMVDSLQREKLFAITPHRHHPGFQGFVNENHIANPERLLGTLLVLSNKLEWGRENVLCEGHDDIVEDDDDIEDFIDSDDSTGHSESESELDIIELLGSPLPSSDDESDY